MKEETRQPAGQIIKVDKVGIDVATGDGVIRITELQLPGKRAMSVQDFLNANTMKVGDHFG